MKFKQMKLTLVVKIKIVTQIKNLKHHEVEA